MMTRKAVKEDLSRIAKVQVFSNIVGKMRQEIIDRSDRFEEQTIRCYALEGCRR